MESLEINSIFQMLEENLTMSSKTDIELLQRLINLCSMESYRQTITRRHWTILLALLSHCQAVVQKAEIFQEDWDFLANIYRCLRNCSAGCYQDENLFSTEELINTALKSLLPQISRHRVNEKEIIALRCGLQMLGNIASQSEKAKEVIWRTFHEKGTFMLLLKDLDQKIVEITMMILHACLTSHHHQKELLSSADGIKLLIFILQLLSDNVIDWGVMLIESVMNNQDFMGIYDILPIQSRLLCLDILVEELESERNLDHLALKSTLKGLKQHFLDSVMDIVKICESSSGDLKSVEITRLLSVLCSASVANKMQSDVQGFSDLLEVSVDALKSVHLLGKNSTNAFSSVSSLRDLDHMSEEEINSHPSYCFKKDLIRLIGNMCYQHKENQDLVRKLDCIPLLMDCCNLDVRNPYIMQWCIFAIRNALESNAENQATMASISLTAEMADSPLMKELGLTVQLENGRPVLVKPNVES